MNALDWAVVVVYMAALLGIGWYFSRSQTSHTEYYLGGRGFKHWEIGLSTIATQLSAVSFISAPAFVGVRPGGGLQWLSYEFAVPLAMIFVMTVVVPPLYRAKIISVYAFLEERFGPGTRVLVSAVFLFSRAFATGIMTYALALVLSVVLGVPVWAMILVAGGVTIVYSVLGGIKAVVYTDVVQMAVLTVGIVACTWVGLDMLGGWDRFTALVDRSRLDAVDFGGLGIGDGREFAFWPMVLGGFFLYSSYYGTDQSQAQRSLAGKDMGQVRGALMFNGLLRFPITFLYCFMGLVLGTVAAVTPALRAQIPADRPDVLVPAFIAGYLPHGLVGLLIISVLSAGMSTMSSTYNSLAAVALEDFVVRWRKARFSDAEYVRVSRWLTVLWGGVCIALAFAAGGIATTIIEAINKVGSLFYGPILATFVLAILSRRATGRAVNVGIVAGVATNFVLWIFFSRQVFWFWWNLVGFVVTTAATLALSGNGQGARARGAANGQPERVELWTRETVILIAYFVTIVAFSTLVRTLL